MAWDERLEPPTPRLTILVMENKINEYFPAIDCEMLDEESLVETYEKLCELLNEDPYEGYELPQRGWSGTYDE